jgi:hypothetical protein
MLLPDDNHSKSALHEQARMALVRERSMTPAPNRFRLAPGFLLAFRKIVA